jgi:hypothetical protein
MVTLGGDEALAAHTMFASWRAAGQLLESLEVDQFCQSLRAKALSLTVLYYCEWKDQWLMADLVPGPEWAEGRNYQATCLSPEQANELARKCGDQFEENVWFATRLREAATACSLLVKRRRIIVVREVVGPSASDEEIRTACGE